MSGKLFLPVRALRQAAKQLNTPFYLYDETGLRQNAAQARAAFSWNAGFSLWFPLRWNASPAILSILRESGCGVECTTAAELTRAERCGFSGTCLCYAPGRLDPEGERLAQSLGAEFVLDDPVFRPGFVPKRVLLRVCPGGRLLWRGRTVVQCEKCKFGMTKREAFFLAEYYASQGAEVGLGVWLAEHDCEPGLYPAVARTLLDWMREFHDRTGRRITFCGLGAGPGSAQQTDAPDIDLAQTAALVQDVAGAGSVRFSAAPGVWLAAHRGMLITRVLTVKERERPLVVLDLPGPVRLWSGGLARQTLLLVGGDLDNVRQLHMYDVVGCGPSLRDHISDRQILPPVKPGDLIALLDVGIHAPDPAIPEFLWSSDGDFLRLTDEPPYRVKAW